MCCSSRKRRTWKCWSSRFKKSRHAMISTPGRSRYPDFCSKRPSASCFASARRRADAKQLALGRLLQKSGYLLRPGVEIMACRDFLNLLLQHFQVRRFLLEQQIRSADRAEMRAHYSRALAAGLIDPLEQRHESAFYFVGFAGQS